MQSIVMDLLEYEARECYYIDKAEKPFLYLCDFIGVPEHPKVNYTVRFADIHSWNFNKLKNAKLKIAEIVQTIQKKGKVIYIKERGKRKKLYPISLREGLK